jgi:hypothetical protein
MALNLETWTSFPEHRSGWQFAMEHLLPLNGGDKGVRVLDFIEKDLSWDLRPPKTPGRQVPDKDIWYQNKIWTVPADTLRMYQKQHTFVLPNEHVVTFDKTKGDWVQVHMTQEEFASLPEDCPIIREPWLGFLHNPSGMPCWFDFSHSPEELLQREITQASLPMCLGIFVFSQAMKEWMLASGWIPASCPVSVVTHPTASGVDIPRFSWEAFESNCNKSLIQVGYWLRHMSAIALINEPAWCASKIWLYGNKHGLEMWEKEVMHEYKDDEARALVRSRMAQVNVLGHLDNATYDELLCKNVVLVHLYRAAANNAIIECIVRATPILVNRLDSTVEYLGADYPLFFTDLEDAARKLQDLPLLKRAHEYLLHTAWVRDRLTGPHFLEEVRSSEVLANVTRFRANLVNDATAPSTAPSWLPLAKVEPTVAPNAMRTVEALATLAATPNNDIGLTYLPSPSQTLVRAISAPVAAIRDDPPCDRDAQRLCAPLPGQ